MIENLVKNVFIGMLKPFSAVDLNKAVMGNISLLDNMIKYSPSQLSLAEKLSHHFVNQKNLLTTENVMIWMMDKRPDLYIVFKNDIKSFRWLDWNTKELSIFLFGE